MCKHAPALYGIPDPAWTCMCVLFSMSFCGHPYCTKVHTLSQFQEFELPSGCWPTWKGFKIVGQHAAGMTGHGQHQTCDQFTRHKSFLLLYKANSLSAYDLPRRASSLPLWAQHQPAQPKGRPPKQHYSHQPWQPTGLQACSNQLIKWNYL